MGSRLKGVYHLLLDEVHLFEHGRNFTRQDSTIFKGLDDPAPGRDASVPSHAAELRDELELVQGASHPFDLEAYLAGKQTPVFFGSAVNNFGVQPLLDFFVEHAPSPQPRATTESRGRSPTKKHSPASCSRSRRTWIRSTATASPSCASARARFAPA